MKLNKILLLNIIVLLFCSVTSCSEKTDMITSSVFAFDTICNVTVYKNSNKFDDDVKDAVDHAEEVLNLNGKGKQFFAENVEEVLPLTPIQMQIIEKAFVAANISDGAFDPTVAALVKLWDISDASVPPIHTDIEQALALIGYEKAEINENSLSFSVQGMGIDLGGIGKGYAGDCIADNLQRMGYGSGIINLGGNVRVFGKNPRNATGRFVVGIKDPENSSDIFCTVSVSNENVITSGAYERFFEYDGKIFHHIIDPSTGYPSESDVKSVTIISADGTYADAASTAVFVLGSTKGMEFLDSLSEQVPDIAAVILCNDGHVETFNTDRCSFNLLLKKYSYEK